MNETVMKVLNGIQLKTKHFIKTTNGNNLKEILER